MTKFETIDDLRRHFRGAPTLETMQELLQVSPGMLNVTSNWLGFYIRQREADAICEYAFKQDVAAGKDHLTALADPSGAQRAAEEALTKARAATEEQFERVIDAAAMFLGLKV